MTSDVMNAELAAMGCLIYGNPAVTHEVLSILRPDDLLDSRNSAILKATHALLLRGVAADPVTVLAELRHSGDVRFHAEQVGPYLLELLVAAPSIGSASHYARAVLQESYRRQVQVCGGRLGQAAESASLDVLCELVSEGFSALSTAAARVNERGGVAK